MKILHRIKQAIARVGDSSGPAISGGAAGAKLGIGEIGAVERDEFPPEEYSEDENDESES